MRSANLTREQRMQVEDRNQQANLLRAVNRVTQVDALAGRVGRLPVVVRQRIQR